MIQNKELQKYKHKAIEQERVQLNNTLQHQYNTLNLPGKAEMYKKGTLGRGGGQHIWMIPDPQIELHNQAFGHSMEEKFKKDYIDYQAKKKEAAKLASSFNSQQINYRNSEQKQKSNLD